MGSTANLVNAPFVLPTRIASETLWYAGYTAARHEKKVAEQLRQREIEHSLPFYETIHRWNNGRHRVQISLMAAAAAGRAIHHRCLRIRQSEGIEPHRRSGSHHRNWVIQELAIKH